MIKNLKVLYTQEELQKRISELAKELDNDYKDKKEIIVISILHGALFFTIDLIKQMNTTMIFDTIHAKSYEGTESTGTLNILDDITYDITGKDVLIVEDIIDTGNTLNKIRSNLLERNPASLKICVLFDKKARRKVEVPVDYIGFDIENKFIIGYGFDYNEKYRNIPYVGYVENNIIIEE